MSATTTASVSSAGPTTAPETVRRRLAIYHDATAPLVDYYESRGLLGRVDGTSHPDEVFAAIQSQLEAAKTRVG